MAKSTKVKSVKKVTEIPPELVITKVVADDTVVKVPMPEPKEVAKIEPTPIVIIPQVVEEKTEEQKIVDYIANSFSDRIELTPILRSLYPVVSFAEPAKYLQQSESKRIKGLLAKMKSEGLITLESDSYLKLGQFYYDQETKTRHWDINTVKIVALK